MVRQALVLAVLFAGVLWVTALHAQPAERKVDNRFLLIFDTSSDMRARLPAVQSALDALLATGAGGQLHPGDSVGVWTFDQSLHTGQFPLQYWKPEDAPVIASNIVKFVKKQHYLNETGLAALQPLLNQVVQRSERLTVLIFCDGRGGIHGTPFDAGINQILQQRQKERQKERLPVVIALRSQRGQYAGCMVSFPPEPVSLPEFPALPEVTHAPSVAAVSAPPRSTVPSLIIIGTPRTNRVPSAPKPAPTNPPPMAATSAPAPAVVNEVKRPDVVPLAPTSPIPVQTNITAAPPTPAKAPAPPPESSGMSFKNVLAIGVAFLAGGLVVFLLRRTR